MYRLLERRVRTKNTKTLYDCSNKLPVHLFHNLCILPTPISIYFPGGQWQWYRGFSVLPQQYGYMYTNSVDCGPHNSQLSQRSKVSNRRTDGRTRAWNTKTQTPHTRPQPHPFRFVSFHLLVNTQTHLPPIQIPNN